MPTARRPNRPEPHSGHCLLAFSVRCTFVYSLRIFMPYLAPRPLSDFLRAVPPTTHRSPAALGPAAVRPRLLAVLRLLLLLLLLRLLRLRLL